jgi:hypothetical protein
MVLPYTQEVIVFGTIHGSSDVSSGCAASNRTDEQRHEIFTNWSFQCAR